MSDRHELVGRVRRRMVSHLPELADPTGLDAAVRAESGGIADDTVFTALRHEVEAELRGAGPLEPLLALPGVTDVLVNAPDAVFFDRGHGMERAALRFSDENAVRRLAQRLVGSCGRRLDDAAPFADATLPDGTRLHAVLPPLAAHTTLSLRVLARQRYALADLVRSATMPAPVAELLRSLVTARFALVISGGTGSGKTTLLGALLGTLAHSERLLVIEDAAELVIEHEHVVRLMARGANVEGSGAVGLRELVRQAVRMRPDRLVVGEFRGAEMVELLVALNTGHEGGAATLHANSALDVPARFVALGALGGLDAAAVSALVSSAIDVVVHLRRGRDGVRRVAEVGLVECVADRLQVRVAWSAASGPHAAAARLAAEFTARDAAVPELLR